MRSLSAGFAMTPAQKGRAGLAKIDNTLAGIAQQAASVPKTQLLSTLQASAAGVRFSLRDPLLVPSVLVDVQVKGDPAAAAGQLRQLGLQHVSVYSNLVSGFLSVDKIRNAAALQGVRFMRASRAKARTGSITSQGDFVQHSDLLRASSLVPGLTGDGITVGVLSDSFACTSSIKSYADDVASGDLPNDVQVLEEYDSGEAGKPCDGAADEGRAMTQIVYDVAPGTKLKFHTAFNGEADFAQGIIDLAAAGAKVITDDVGYFDEPIFQDGIVSQAVDQVTAQGVAYFSSAGNSARQSYEASYKDSGTVGTAGADNEGEKLMAFVSTDGTTTLNYLPFSVPGGFQEQSVQILEWDQPYVTGAAGSGGATSSIDICLTDASGAVISGFCSGANPVGSDPVSITGLITDGTTTAYGLQIGIVGGTPPPGRIKIIFQDDGGGTQADPAFATFSSTVQGHPAAAGANAVGASYFRANPVCLPAIYPNYTLEDYSSAGGSPVLFDKTGAALANAVVRQKPNFVAPDGGNTTFFAQQLGARSATVPQCTNAAGTWNFFGTSAAAPHAAGVAALLMQAQPLATPDLVRKALQDTAILGMATADGTVQTAVNFDTGYGYIQADAALPRVLPAVQLSGTSLSFGDVRVGTTSAQQELTLTNTGGFPLTIQSVTASSGFTAGGDCPSGTSTLAPAAHCTIEVAAAPAATGAQGGIVTITTDAKSSPDMVALSANGVQSFIALSVKLLDFGSVNTGVAAPAQTVTLTNTGTATLDISQISVGGSGTFTQSSTCPAAVVPGGTCTITVNFKPTDEQHYVGAVDIASDAAAGSQNVLGLFGIGTTPSSGSSGGGAFGLWMLLPGFAVAGLRRRKRS